MALKRFTLPFTNTYATVTNFFNTSLASIPGVEITTPFSSESNCINGTFTFNNVESGNVAIYTSGSNGDYNIFYDTEKEFLCICRSKYIDDIDYSDRQISYLASKNNKLTIAKQSQSYSYALDKYFRVYNVSIIPPNRHGQARENIYLFPLMRSSSAATIFEDCYVALNSSLTAGDRITDGTHNFTCLWGYIFYKED